MTAIWDARSKLMPLAITALLFASLREGKPATLNQGPGPSEPFGTIAGHVFCADTDRPARFARITVQPAIGVDRGDLKGVQENAILTRADMEGRFSLNSISPGKYYLLAWLPGYESPLSALTIEDFDHDKRSSKAVKSIESLLPRVSVEAGLTSSIDITLERGAEVSGTVNYDDGSPVIGAQIGILRQRAESHDWDRVVVGNSFVTEDQVETDDRGRYRLSGLPAGRYLISARLPTKSFNGIGIFTGSGRDAGNASLTGNLEVFSGSSVRQKDATPITISKDEHLVGVDLTIPISRLYGVSGIVVAQKDGHSMKAGTIEILYGDDSSVAQRARLTDSGQFQFNFLPSGKYVIRVIGATDDINPSKSGRSSAYQPTEEHIDVEGSDVDDVVLHLREIRDFK